MFRWFIFSLILKNVKSDKNAPTKLSWKELLLLKLDISNYGNGIKDLEIASDGDITIEAPELAENGTNVPVKLSTKIPQANFIALMADHNPNPVCVGFHVLPNTEPTYSVRVKVAETSSLLAVVRSNNKWFYSSKDIVVMIGGCLA